MTEPMSLKTLQNFKHWFLIEKHGSRIFPIPIAGTPPPKAWLVGNSAWVFENGHIVAGYVWKFADSERSEHD